MLIHQNISSNVTRVSAKGCNKGDVMLEKGARASKGHISSSKVQSKVKGDTSSPKGHVPSSKPQLIIKVVTQCQTSPDHHESIIADDVIIHMLNVQG